MRVIESLYIVDSSGLCLYCAALTSAKQQEPDLISGFIVAQFQYFRDAYGEETKRFTLEKKEIAIQSLDSGKTTTILAIVYAQGNEREEKFSEAFLDRLVNALKPKQKILARTEGIVPKALEGGITEVVDEVSTRTPCLYLVKGFLGLADHCDKVDAPTGNRPCNFNYAVKQCEYYSSKVS